jgi:hypothetical protein
MEQLIQAIIDYVATPGLSEGAIALISAVFGFLLKTFFTKPQPQPQPTTDETEIDET